MNFDFKQFISLKEADASLHEQISRGLLELILRGTLTKGQRLPSINSIAANLDVNRLTVMRALDDLEAEGWLRKEEKKGVFVNSDLPVYNPQPVVAKANGYEKPLTLPELTLRPLKQDYSRLSFNDGYPDHRFFPQQELARAYSTVMKDNFSKKLLSYHDLAGYQPLLETLKNYLTNTRSLNFEYNDLMVTRGSTMGLALAMLATLSPGETLVMNSPGYYLVKEAAEAFGFNIKNVATDEKGMDVNALEALAMSENIKMVFVTPHHDYPTTVSMPAERRVKLLQLAEKCGFLIVEDDYDFDFQYDNKPVWPIASLNPKMPVIYCGGFSKSLSPAIRIGFMVASPEIIERACRWRKIIDRQGDTIQEAAFEKILLQGVIDKAIRKARKAYKQRRDLAFELLSQHLPQLYETHLPEGGLAFWAKINPKVNYQKVIEAAFAKGLYLIPPDKFSKEATHARLGFASMNEEELREAVRILREILLH